MRKKLSILLGTVLLITLVAAAQQQPQSKGGQQKPLLSPRRNAETTIDGKKVTVDYGAPSMRNRKIMGNVVPFDKVWRTGANEATSFKTEADLMVNGTRVPAGSYTLYTLPSANGWKLIINKQTGQWGTQYDQSQDLARVDMKVSQIAQPTEQMKITFEPAQDGSATMHVVWENTDASVDLKPAKS